MQKKDASGLRGMIRRFAHRYNESSFGHWFPLIFADRINVAEGILGDFSKGKVPNILKEKGRKSAWKHNRRKFTTGIVVKAVIAAAVFAMIFAGQKQKKRKRRPAN